jgi:hypothetical protein
MAACGMSVAEAIWRSFTDACSVADRHAEDVRAVGRVRLLDTASGAIAIGSHGPALG